MSNIFEEANKANFQLYSEEQRVFLMLDLIRIEIGLELKLLVCCIIYLKTKQKNVAHIVRTG